MDLALKNTITEMHILVKLRQKCILNENFSLKMISNAKKKSLFSLNAGYGIFSIVSAHHSFSK